MKRALALACLLCLALTVAACRHGNLGDHFGRANRAAYDQQANGRE